MDDLISKLSEIRSEYNCFDEDEEPYYRALSTAIRILSRHTDGDTISRQEAIDALGEEPEVWTGKDEYAQGLNNQWHYDVNALKALPSAERHGRWIDVEPAPHNLFYATCSVCGDRQTIEVANYCPMCGASMDEVEE